MDEQKIRLLTSIFPILNWTKTKTTNDKIVSDCY